jgi:hypothetical protein
MLVPASIGIGPLNNIYRDFAQRGKRGSFKNNVVKITRCLCRWRLLSPFKKIHKESCLKVSITDGRRLPSETTIPSRATILAESVIF